uniref:Uncharacterized protein n=1 Tax=Chlamydomonas leiostraca TaxID=1034604 RepID=A0A7S0R8P6_9CHLO
MARSALVLALMACVALLPSGTLAKFWYGEKKDYDTIIGVRGAWVRTYMETEKVWTRGRPAKAVGVEMSKALFDNIEKVPRQQMTVPPPINFNLDGFEVILAMPDQQQAHSFSKVRINYNKGGHPLAGVYDVDHFDVHFDWDPQPVWDTMFNLTTGPDGPCEGVTPDKYSRVFEPLPKQCFPPDHTQAGQLEWGHGSHLFPLKAPEFNPPRRFNQTLIFGTWGGQVRFVEPMAATSWLKSKAVTGPGSKGVFFSIANPAYYPDDRYVAGRYGYIWSNQKTLKFELRSMRRAAVGCKYNPRLGWAGFRPPIGTPNTVEVTFSPVELCPFPTPDTWKPAA